MDAEIETVKQVVYHHEFNLQKRDNLNELPSKSAVFGVFGIVDNEPINCRYVSSTENLREAVTALFERTEDDGLKKFMHGSWVQMVQYQLTPDEKEGAIQREVQSWIEKYQPKVDETGDHPGYYE